MSNFFNSLFSDKGEIKGIDNQYSVSEIVDILKEEGYSINVIQDNFLVFRLQGTNVVVVPHDGGDIQFFIMYDDDENRFSLRKVNKINIDYRSQLCYNPAKILPLKTREIMTALNVLIYPDDHLKVVCEPVTEVNDAIRKIVDDMFDTMYQEKGIGLAAPQVDILQRIITIDVEGDKQNQFVLINPEILASEGETGIEEGCLSIPGFRALVPRKEKVTVRALDRDGKEFTLDADGLLAICIQHEIDHLNGILFVDYLSPLKRQRIKEKLIKYKKQIAKS